MERRFASFARPPRYDSRFGQAWDSRYSCRYHLLMYWLYLTLFLSMLLIPRFSGESWFPTIINREITEIIFLFIFSSLMFAIYILRDYQFVRYQKNFEAKQKEAAHLLKDLSTTYSYIGETNRKIEILRDLMADFPELLEEKGRGSDSMYADILRAIHSFTSCSEFVIRFYNQKDKTIARELWSSETFAKSMSQEIDPEHLLKDETRSMERQGEYLILRARGTFDHTCCYAIFHKNYLKKENIEIVRSLMVQALFFHTFSNRMSPPLLTKEGGDTME